MLNSNEKVRSYRRKSGSGQGQQFLRGSESRIDAQRLIQRCSRLLRLPLASVCCTENRINRRCRTYREGGGKLLLRGPEIAGVERDRSLLEESLPHPRVALKSAIKPLPRFFLSLSLQVRHPDIEMTKRGVRIDSESTGTRLVNRFPILLEYKKA